MLQQGLLSKEATSRWREALRSGEVSGEAAEALKRKMRVQPGREGRGLVRGARNIAARKGFDFTVYHSPLDVLSKLVKADGRNQLARAVTELYGGIGGGGAGVSFMAGPTPTTVRRGGVFGFPAKANAKKNKLFIDQIRKRLTAAESANLFDLFMSHEGSEAKHHMKMFKEPYNIAIKPSAPIPPGIAGATRGLRLGRILKTKGKAPTEIFMRAYARNIATQLSSPVVAGKHANPQVILEEMRNSRMFSPNVQSAMHNLRSRTGELGQVNRAVGGEVYSRPKLPKKELSRISKKVQEVAGKDLAKAEQRIYERMAKPLPGEAYLRKLLRPKTLMRLLGKG